MAEISRLVVVKDHRDRLPGGHRLLLGLFRELYEESRRLGIGGLIATMEDGLLRFLRRMQLCFDPIGAVIQYFGAVTPHFALVNSFDGQYRSRFGAPWAPAHWDVLDAAEVRFARIAGASVCLVP